MRRLMLIVTLVGALGLTACDSDDTNGEDTANRDAGASSGDSPEERLADARSRWEAAGVADYDWSYQVTCFCPGVAYDLEVRAGRAVDVVIKPSDSGALPPDDDPDREPTFRTVEQLFDTIEATQDAAEQRVTYDEETGRPLTVSVDPQRNVADDEVSYSVTAFTERGLG